MKNIEKCIVKYDWNKSGRSIIKLEKEFYSEEEACNFMDNIKNGDCYNNFSLETV